MPNKRGELFLKKAIGSITQKPLLAPQMQTVESFVQEAAGLNNQSQLQLAIHLFRIYREKINPEETFNNFLKWANTLLYDFNEIDRHLVDHHQLFTNLLDAKTIESWGVEPGSETALMSTFLSFWRDLKPLYEQFTAKLLEQGISYQGLAYRKVAEDVKQIDHYLNNRFDGIYLLGFNALNKAEEIIFQHLIGHHSAIALWDIDRFYLEDDLHEAGAFLRQYRKTWPAFANHPFEWVGDAMASSPKKVQVMSALSGQGLAKATGQLLQTLPDDEQTQTAVVLADEALLIPLLDHVPDTFESINVTMGFPVRHAPLAQDLLHLLKLHEQAERTAENSGYSYHHKRFLAVIESRLFRQFAGKAASTIVQQLVKQNQSFISPKSAQGLLASHLNEDSEWAKIMAKPERAVDVLSTLDSILLQYIQATENADKLERESAFALHQSHTQLLHLLAEAEEPIDMRTLVILYRNMMNDHQVDFYGEPLAGLQIMGMLETRTLDFKRVVITSLNEGVLPAGKSQNSFIPMDLKLHFGLPTHHEKDAVYAYHFYRLLQRAEEIFLLYDSDTQSLGTRERSRFIAQIEHEWANLPNVKVLPTKHLNPTVKKESLHQIPSYNKDQDVAIRLQQMAEKGLSPSALSAYINDPTLFFEERVMRVNDPDEIAETIGYDVLGTVVHDALEELYKPLVGKLLVANRFAEMFDQAEPMVRQKLVEHYRGNIDQGRNLLIKDVANHMVKIALESDRDRVTQLESKNETLVVRFLEHELQAEAAIPGISFPIKFRGIADRIDQIGDSIFVLDYKTGSMTKSDLKTVGVDHVFEPGKKSKAFQVLFYAWLYEKNFGMPQGALKAGIFSTRSPGNGFMELEQNKSTLIEQETLREFETQLFNLVRELFEATQPFEPRFITLKTPRHSKS